MSQQRTTVVFGLFVASLLNAFYIFSHAYTAFRPPSAQVAQYSYIGHDFPERLPLPINMELVTMTAEETVHFLPLGGPSEGAWRTIASPGYGFVRLGPEDRTFSISMFHELHCLRMINRGFTKTQGATTAHLKHCLNYIRQNILCSPDMTLEPGNFEERDFEVDRVGGTHACQNWEDVYRFVDDNFGSWSNKTGFVY